MASTHAVPVLLLSLALCGGAWGEAGPPGAAGTLAGEPSLAADGGEAHGMAGSRCQTGPRRLRAEE